MFKLIKSLFKFINANKKSSAIATIALIVLLPALADFLFPM